MRKSKVQPIRGARALARAVGVSHTAVGGWLKDPRWPFGPSPWAAATVEKIRLWQRNTLAPDPAKGLPPAEASAAGRKASQLGELSRTADISLKVTKQKHLQFKLELDQGKFHRVDECQQRRVRQIQEVKRLLTELADGLPFQADVKELVRNRILGVLRALAS